MKQKWILTMIFVMVQLTMWAQELQVLDAITRTPLPYVSVVAGKSSHITNENGQVVINDLEKTGAVTFSFLGYGTQTMDFTALQRAKFRILLQPIDMKLDEVVVSATRWMQSRSELVQRVSAIRSSDIALQNPQTAADLIGQTGEVFIQKSQQGGGSPMIRGFATNRLLIAVDGIRMNTAIFRSGNIQNIISVDPYSVASAEVLFGPGSIVYGSDAIGGVMLFNTLKPVLSDKGTIVNGNAGTRFASANNELSTHLDVSIGGPKWASVTSFSFNRFGDLRMGTNGPESYLKKYEVVRMDSVDRVVTNNDPLVQKSSGFSQQNILQKLVFQPNENWRFEYGFYYSTTSDYARYDRLLRLKKKLPRSAEWYYGPQKWMMNRLTVNHKKPTFLYDEMQLNLAFQKFEESRHDRDLNKAVKFNRMEKVDAFSLNLDFNKEISVNNRLLYGAEMVLNQVDSKGTDENVLTGVVAPGPARYPESTWSSYALFATYQHHLNNKTMLQAGARYSLFMLDATFDTSLFALPFKEASLNSGALTGSIGLVHKASESFSLSTNISTGYRSPNVDDVGKIFDSEPGFVVVPNPNLKAEYAYNGDIGFSKIFAEKFRLDFTAFYTVLTDALVRRNYSLNGADSIMYAGEMSRVQAIQNAAQATVYGIHGGIEWKLPYGFSMMSNLTWQKGEEELDNGTKSPLRHAAPLFGLSRLRYTTNKMTLELNVAYADKVNYADMPEEEKSKDYMYAADADGNPYSPSWYTLNFKAVVKVEHHLIIGGGIENITDQRYRTYSSGMVGAGRNFVLSLQVPF